MGWTVLVAVAGLVVAGVLYQAIGAARDRRRFGAPGAFASVGSHRLHYRCDGAGTPAVILEAGIAASSLTWSRVQPVIARETRVCSYDRAGLAWSEPASSARSTAALVSELRALVTGADIPPPYVLVAHSFGALIIRAFARAHPSEVAGLVFVDPLHPEEWCDPSPNQRQNASRRHLPVAARRGARAAWCRALLPGAAQRRRARSAPTVQPPVRPQGRGAARAPGRRGAEAAAGGAAVGAGALVASESVPRDVAAPRRRCPRALRISRGAPTRSAIFLWWCCRLDLVPRMAGRRRGACRASSNGRHIVSPRSGHWIHLDDPDLVIQAIRDVITSRRIERSDRHVLTRMIVVDAVRHAEPRRRAKLTRFRMMPSGRTTPGCTSAPVTGFLIGPHSTST